MNGRDLLRQSHFFHGTKKPRHFLDRIRPSDDPLAWSVTLQGEGYPVATDILCEKMRARIERRYFQRFTKILGPTPNRNTAFVSPIRMNQMERPCGEGEIVTPLGLHRLMHRSKDARTCDSGELSLHHTRTRRMGVLGVREHRIALDGEIGPQIRGIRWAVVSTAIHSMEARLHLSIVLDEEHETQIRPILDRMVVGTLIRCHLTDRLRGRLSIPPGRGDGVLAHTMKIKEKG